MPENVFEVHGVSCRMAGYSDRRSVIIREREGEIFMDARKDDLVLTPLQARYLAAKLYRLSRRIRDREAPND